MKHLRLTLTMLTIFSINYIDAIQPRGPKPSLTEPGEPTRQQSGVQTRGQRRSQAQSGRQTQPTIEPGQEEPGQQLAAPQQEGPSEQKIVGELRGVEEDWNFKDIYDYINKLDSMKINYVFSGNKFSEQFINDTITQVRTAGLSNIELEFLLRTARDKFIGTKLTGNNTQDLEILKAINQQIQEAKNQISSTPQPATRRRRVAPTASATTKPAAQTQRSGTQRARTRGQRSYRGGM